MPFHKEPSLYSKTIISDLQGAWCNLREAVLKDHESRDCSQLLFHIDEAMSWESVRNLAHMKSTLVLIQSIAQQMRASGEVMMWIEEVRDTLSEALDETKQGKKV